jgi:NAD(P)-dependent dehydrogenase (short-subunit alcohol dehydrogenase family)
MSTKNVATLITGASRGLGAALAQALAEQGARLALVARNQPALEAVVSTIRERGGVAYPIVADVGDKAAIHAIAQQATALLGPIDLLIHNASTLGPTPLPLLLDTECEDLERTLQVNLLGPFRLSKILVGSMALRQAGTVVHISSDAAVEAYPRWGGYGVSKAALDHLARSFAAELSDQGVRFLSIDPGEMNTQMHAAAIPEADPATLADPAQVAAQIVALLAKPSARAAGPTRYSASELRQAVQS